MEYPPGVVGDADPPGESKYRRWLSRNWSLSGRKALVIGINPNTATRTRDDQFTRFVRELLEDVKGVYECGGFILVNCLDRRHSRPEELKDLPSPCRPSNIRVVEAKMAECDYIVASWGTKRYGEMVQDKRKEVAALVLVRRSGKDVVCFATTGQPIYCNARNRRQHKDWSAGSLPVAWNAKS